MGNQIDSNSPPIFNGQYTVLSQIGEGKTSLVYLAESIADPSQKVAIKILKKSLKQSLKKKLLVCNSTTSQDFVFAKKEMEIHSKLDHKTIVKMIECGQNGKIYKPNGKSIEGLFYFVMEYNDAGELFDIVQ